MQVNVWPDEKDHPGFKEFCEAHYRKMVHVTKAMLKGSFHLTKFIPIQLLIFQFKNYTYLNLRTTLCNTHFLCINEMENSHTKYTLRIFIGAG